MSKPNRFDGMMDEVCMHMGFSVLYVTDNLPKTGVISAEQFASWVLEAEGMPSEVKRADWHRLKAVFSKHMGAEVVDAKFLNDLIND